MLRFCKILVGAATAALLLFASPLAAQMSDIGSAQLLRMPNIGAYPPGSTATNASSGNVAAATGTATLAAVAAKMNWIYGFDVYGAGATAASVISCTVTGLTGGTATFSLPIPAGAAVAIVPLQVRFPEPLPATAVNVAIAVSCPTFGAGNTNATVNAYGFQTTATGP